MPPEPDALHVTGLPAVALPHVALTMRFCPWTVTLAVPVFVAPLVSVAVTVMVLVPLTAYVVVKLEPLPEDGLAPGADQENVNGEVPPEADAVHVTGFPTVAVPQVTVTVMGWPATLTVAVPACETPLVSFAVAVTVWDPLLANVVV